MFEAVVVILAALLMALLAVAMGYVLGWANKAFHVYVDPRVETANVILPGANCGACGYVGCNEFAEAVVAGEAAVNKCTVGGASVASDLAQLLGVEVEETWPYRAVVHCAATYADRLGLNPYLGDLTCSSANVISGVQACAYGCLGFADCVRACEYDAIHVRDGLAVVDYEKCTGCGKCSPVCPRNLITMVPFKADRMLVVACSNKDFGKDVRAVCTVGCIGCKQCELKSSLFKMVDNLAQLDYGEYNPQEADFTAVLEKCPMETLVYVGKPSSKDLEAVEDEEFPRRVMPDFRTTVDRTRWWG